MFRKFIFYKFAFRLIWMWDQGVKILKDQDIPIDQSKLQAEEMKQFIEQKLWLSTELLEPDMKVFKWSVTAAIEAKVTQLR